MLLTFIEPFERIDALNEYQVAKFANANTEFEKNIGEYGMVASKVSKLRKATKCENFSVSLLSAIS